MNHLTCPTANNERRGQLRTLMWYLCPKERPGFWVGCHTSCLPFVWWCFLSENMHHDGSVGRRKSRGGGAARRAFVSMKACGTERPLQGRRAAGIVVSDGLYPWSCAVRRLALGWQSVHIIHRTRPVRLPAESNFPHPRMQLTSGASYFNTERDPIIRP